MTQLTFIKTIIILAGLYSCKNRDKQISIEPKANNKIIKSHSIKTALVDYKSTTYKISLGESYKISEKLIDWQWAALNDEDNKIDSTSIDAFHYSGEPLISYNNEEWLPSLHIETDKNIITSFTYSILFDLEDNAMAVDSFLRVVSRDIKMLRYEHVVNLLKSNGVYETTSTEYTETYKLKKAKELGYDQFEYKIVVKS